MPHLKVSRALERLIRTPKPIKVAYGGRSSGKSIGFGDIFIFKMLTEKADIYCLREHQNSINDSVHKVFKSSVTERLKLDGWQLQSNSVISPDGAYTAYKGASRSPDSIQSAQDFKYSWFEEAHTMSQESLDKLLPTILRNEGAECWFSGNPQSSADPFSQRFITPFQEELDKNGYYEDDMHLIVEINWRDNPWHGDEQDALRLWDYNNRPRAEYDWIWEGKFNDSVDGSIIKPEWFDAAIDAHKLPNLAKMFEPKGAKIAAYDPFDDGGDAGGYALRHGSIIRKVASKTSGEIDAVTDWATGLAAQDHADHFVWDGDGMGTGLKRQISDNFNGSSTKWHMFRGSLSGKGQDNGPKLFMVDDADTGKTKTYAETFKNNRAQYYMELARRFHNTYNCVINGTYENPDDMISLDKEGIENIQGLRSQLCRIPAKHNQNGLMQIMSKQDMARLGIASPNEGDSVMMSLFAPTVAETLVLNFKRLN